SSAGKRSSTTWFAGSKRGCEPPASTSRSKGASANPRSPLTSCFEGGVRKLPAGRRHRTHRADGFFTGLVRRVDGHFPRGDGPPATGCFLLAIGPTRELISRKSEPITHREA